MTEINTETKLRPKIPKGGPHGLGDPEDKTLRIVEKTIVIPKKLKEEAIKKCSSLVRKYLECAQKSGFMVISRCREENFAQQECVAKWMNDQDLIKKVTDQYLEDRSYYRKTGIPVHSVLLEKHKIKLSDLPED